MKNMIAFCFGMAVSGIALADQLSSAQSYELLQGMAQDCKPGLKLKESADYPGEGWFCEDNSASFIPNIGLMVFNLNKADGKTDLTKAGITKSMKSLCETCRLDAYIVTEKTAGADAGNKTVMVLMSNNK